MNIFFSLTAAAALLLTGVAIGFQAGKASGFETGSEWAIIEAGLLAREAGVYMPVRLDENSIRVVVKQPRGLYTRARQCADQYDRRKVATRKSESHSPDEKNEPNTAPKELASL